MNKQTQVLASCKGLKLFKNTLVTGYTVMTPTGKTYIAANVVELERFIQAY
jgi:hypothetical protein